MRHYILIFIILLFAAVLLFSLVSCGGEKYRVIYEGSKDIYEKAKDYYKAGQKVVLYYPYVATDTDYTFYVDNEAIAHTYDEKRGFVISFIMPAHDVTLSMKSVNSMEYTGE